MKKFYTLLLGATVAMSAAASAPQTLSALNETMTFTKKAEVRETPSFSLIKKTETSRKRIGANIPLSSVAGDYKWRGYSALESTAGWMNLTASIEIADEATGAVKLLLDDTFELDATFANGKLSIPANQFLGNSGKFDVYFYHWRFNDNGKGTYPLDTPLTGNATISEEDEVTISFDKYDIIIIGNEEKGFYLANYANTFTQAASEEIWDNSQMMPEEGWVEHGTSTFVDPWHIPAYQLTNTDYPYDVKVERNTEYEGLYRIVNPYAPGTPIGDTNDNFEQDGYILFSIINPDFVTVYPMVWCGLIDEVGAYLNFNLEGYAMLVAALYPDQTTLAEMIEDMGLTEFSTYENNVVTLLNNRFATVEEPDQVFNWKDENDNPILANGSLTLTAAEEGGVDNVAADFNGEVKYYNLQGMPVENPGNGIYIKQEGNKTFKVRVVR